MRERNKPSLRGKLSRFLCHEAPSAATDFPGLLGKLWGKVPTGRDCDQHWSPGTSASHPCTSDCCSKSDSVWLKRQPVPNAAECGTGLRSRCQNVAAVVAEDIHLKIRRTIENDTMPLRISESKRSCGSGGSLC